MRVSTLRLVRIPYNQAVANLSRCALVKYGVALIEDLPLDEDCNYLINLADELGSISSHGIGPSSNSIKSKIHRIEPLPEEKTDRFGNRVLSSTADAMECHTDDSFSDNPAKIVMLHVVKPGLGGDSLIVPLMDIVSSLQPALIGLLQQPLYPTPNGYRAIISQNSCFIRFSKYEIGKMIAGGMPILENGAAAVRELSRFLSASAQVLRMRRGECLVVDNHKVLHGRTAVDPSSERLLFRVRLNCLKN